MIQIEVDKVDDAPPQRNDLVLFSIPVFPPRAKLNPFALARLFEMFEELLSLHSCSRIRDRRAPPDRSSCPLLRQTRQAQ